VSIILLVLVESCSCSVIWVREDCRAGLIEGEGRFCSIIWVSDGCLIGFRWGVVQVGGAWGVGSLYEKPLSRVNIVDL
jgi:hypothetical protein